MADVLNESLEQLNALTVKYENCQVARDNEIEALRRRCSEFEIIESGNELLEKRLKILDMEVDELNREKKEILERYFNNNIFFSFFLFFFFF